MIIQTSCSPITWEPQLSDAQSQSIQFKISASIITMPNGDIWSIVEQDGIPKSLIRYNPDAKSLRTYTIETFTGRGLPFKLFVSKNGTLWGMEFQYEGQFTGGRHTDWMLYRYDAESDSFFRVYDTGRLLRGKFVMDATEDPQGNLWIVLEQEDLRRELIRYDPTSNEASKIDLDPKLQELSVEKISRIASASDGSIWMMGEVRRSSTVQQTTPITLVAYRFAGTVLQFNPTTDTIKDYGAPLGGMFFRDRLYFDRSGNLWTSSIARLSFPKSSEPVWLPKVQPDAFVKEEGDRTWWMDPFAIYQSSDGRLWFSSRAGLVMHDPQKNTWQRVNDWSSAVVEDEHGRLWTAANNQLYSFDLKR